MFFVLRIKKKKGKQVNSVTKAEFPLNECFYRITILILEKSKLKPKSK